MPHAIPGEPVKISPGSNMGLYFLGSGKIVQDGRRGGTLPGTLPETLKTESAELA